MTSLVAKNVHLRSENDIVEARLESRALAQALGFSLSDQTLIATAVSEITRNMITYAKEGVVTIEKISEPSLGIVITATDNGPGIANLENAMRDGFSTGGGLGLGLPGAKRLMDEFEIESSLGTGTKITMKKFVNKNELGRR